MGLSLQVCFLVDASEVGSNLTELINDTVQ